MHEVGLDQNDGSDDEMRRSDSQGYSGGGVGQGSINAVLRDWTPQVSSVGEDWTFAMVQGEVSYIPRGLNDDLDELVWIDNA